MKTLKRFCAVSDLPESLIRGVVRLTGGWKGFPVAIPDADELEAFAQRNLISVLRLCLDRSESKGSSVPGFIVGLIPDGGISEEDVKRVIGRAADNETQKAVLAAMARFAVDEVAAEWMRIKK